MKEGKKRGRGLFDLKAGFWGQKGLFKVKKERKKDPLL